MRWIDVLYHRANFGEHRTTPAGCRCENAVFVCLFLSRSESITLCFRGGYILNRHCVTVYASIFILFSSFFT